MARGKAAKVVGRYQLAHELAPSYLGPLWAARVEGGASGQLAMLRLVSLARLDADTRVRLLEAAWQAMEVRDDHVCAVTDVVASDGELGVISDFVEGLPLRALQGLASVRRKPMPIPIALRIVVDLIEGVAGLHRATLELGDEAVPLYGGLSADSVLVGTDGRSAILDVAVASVAASVESLGGNPERVAYDAPEQVSPPHPADARTDVFTLGVLAWELLSSRRLFIGADKAVAQKVLAAKIPRLDEVKRKGDPDVPASLLGVVTRALERDAGARYQTVLEFRQALAETGVAPGTTQEVAEYVATVAEGALSRVRDTLKTPAAAPRAAPAAWGKLNPPEAVRATTTVAVGEPKAAPARPAVPVRKPAPVTVPAAVKPTPGDVAPPPAAVRPRQPTMLGIPLPSQVETEAAARSVVAQSEKAETARPAPATLVDTVAPPATEFLDDDVESLRPATGAAPPASAGEESTGRYSFSDLAAGIDRVAPATPLDEPPTRPREPKLRLAAAPVPEPAIAPTTEVANFEGGVWLDDPISSNYPTGPASTPTAPVAAAGAEPAAASIAVTPLASEEEVAPARIDPAPPPWAAVPEPEAAPVEPRRPVRAPVQRAEAISPTGASRAPDRPVFSRPPPAQPYVPSQIPPPLIHDPRANRLVSAPPPPPAPQFNRGVLIGVVVSLGLVIASAAIAMFALKSRADLEPRDPTAATEQAAAPTPTVTAPRPAPAPPPEPAASAAVAGALSASAPRPDETTPAPSAQPGPPGTAAPAPAASAPVAAPAAPPPGGSHAQKAAPRRAKKKTGRFVPDDI